MGVRDKIKTKEDKEKAKEVIRLKIEKVKKRNASLSPTPPPSKKVGRPTKMTKVVLGYLREAFKVGATDLEACAYAGIDHTTLYKYCNDYPEFSKEKERLKLLPLVKARNNVITDIARGDIGSSKWYLERKKKGEFAQRTEHSVEGEIKHGVIVLPAQIEDNKATIDYEAQITED